MDCRECAVLFDMDGVLVDTARPHYESWVRVARQRGAQITWDDYHQTFGRPNAEVIPELFGRDFTPEEISEIDREKEALFREFIREQIEPMPGVVRLIQELEEMGFRLAVGSSAPPENIELMLSAIGVLGYFRGVVCAEDVARGKPHPEVFLKAAGIVGADPHNCLVIEDVPAGIEAAHRAGMQCVAVTTTRSAHELAAAELVLPDLSGFHADQAARMLGCG